MTELNLGSSSWVNNELGGELATLLEGAGYLLFSSAIEKLLKYILRWNKCVKLAFKLYRLADRLWLLKCYDRKTVKLPGCLSIEASSCSKPTKKMN